MKRKDIKIGMEVAVVRSESWGADYGIVESLTADRRVYHGSRDFSGSIVSDSIAVRIYRQGRPTEQVQKVPVNQIKDAAETRAMAQAKQDRKSDVEAMLARQKSDTDSAVEILRARGLKSAAASPNTAYGDYRITGWSVKLSPADALQIAGTWSKDA